MTLLTMWTTYAVFGVLVCSAVFLWAVRTRQFSSEDRARRLPLECPTGVGAEPAETASDRRLLAVPLGLLVLAAGVIAALLVCVYVR
ncbi:MAG: hypothetical protein FJX75_10970 [Armatimonadetes bacterium]|nr:hypothetical protein [Armatimonadota bacterium]